MNPLLESCLTFLAAYGVLYVLAYALTGGILLVILVYSWWGDKSYSEQGKFTEWGSVLMMMVVGPMALGMLPPEFQIIFWQGLPYILLMTVSMVAIQMIFDRKLGTSQEEKQ